MPAGKMHADEIDIDASLARRLVAAQFPQWADLLITPVRSAGTDNAMYRLGAEMALRFPRVPRVVAQVEKEQRWLPWLAPQLPLAIPMPLARGLPGDGYPWNWSVYRWLEGENAAQTMPSAFDQAAVTLAGFISALWTIDPADGPMPGAHNFGRGVPLAERDAATRQATAELGDTIDADAVSAVWESALAAPEWSGPPVWIHGDLMPGNLLVRDGQISAVIDFGGLGVGDPACDLQIAWNFLPADARAVFRAALAVDDATWRRGRGWALSVSLIALPYYRETNPVFARASRRTLDAVLADAGAE